MTYLLNNLFQVCVGVWFISGYTTNVTLAFFAIIFLCTQFAFNILNYNEWIRTSDRFVEHLNSEIARKTTTRRTTS